MHETPAPAPLTHHEIVALAAPFTQRGFAVDLPASDRAARRIGFRPQALPDGLTQSLTLSPGPRGWQLERRVHHAQGAQALTTVQGTDPAELATRLDAQPAAAGFEQGEAWLIAWQLRLPDAGPPVLAGATLQLDGLSGELKLSAVDRIPAEVMLHAPGADLAELPSDLLAVLGLPWSRLERKGAGWRASLGLRGRGGARGTEAMAQWRAAAAHLATTLARPPSHFHQQHFARRWGVTLRRAVPLGVCLGVIAAALAVPALKLPEDSVFRMLIFNAPPILLGLLFAFRELPRIEVPPPPRRLTAPSWRRAPPEGPR